MTSPPTTSARGRGGILGPAYLATTIAVFALIAFNAFEALAVTTVMPTISRELDGIGLYALAFAAPLASGVVGMVAAGSWSDRRGPAVPLLVSLVLFSIGVLTCGLAPSMEVLVAGRVVQGLGTGALIVSLYVVVGVVYPAALQPSIFASFAAAWVLPALFGPGLAALVADVLGWRWVFLGVVALVMLAAALLAPVVPTLRTADTTDGEPASRSRLAWSVVAAVMVLAVELLGSGDLAVAAVPAIALVLVALRPLTPRGTLIARRGLPSVIGTRGLMSGSFFCGQAYIVLVLQQRWDLSAGQAGIALTVVGLVWASASQLQARLRDHLTSERAMLIGTVMLLGAGILLWVVVWQHWSAWLAGGAFVIAGCRDGTRVHPHRGGDAGRVVRRRPRLQLLGALDRRLARGGTGAVDVRHRVHGGHRRRPRPLPRGVRRRDPLRRRGGGDRVPDALPAGVDRHRRRCGGAQSPVTTR